ncbi:MAG: cell division protein ZapA [Bacteroidetes bacterium]|nr:cell division protein ZapA [Bacteroidota bacterium]MCY4225752.1 cell division protein ZapA [Bacteroidota bacterium]
MSQQSVNLRIFERDYRILINPDDYEMVTHLAENLNERKASFTQQYGDQPDLVAAVFIALELAQELYQEQESSNDLLTSIDHEVDYMDRVIALVSQQTSTESS